MSTKMTPYFQLMLAMILVGSSVVVGKMLTVTLPVMLTACLRFAIATPVLFCMLYLWEGIPSMPSRSSLITLFLQALTGVFLFSVFLLFGLKHTGAIEAGLITGTLPAVTATLSLILLQDKLNRFQVIGIICTVIGAVIINAKFEHSSEITSSSSLLGACLVFGAIICEALYVVFGKHVVGKISALTISTIVCGMGFLLFLPFGIWDAYHFDFSQTSTVDWLLMVYFGLAVTVLSFWLFYAGLAKVPASVAGAFMAFIPLSAIIFSSLFLGESIQSMHIMGGAWIIVGILLACITTTSKTNLETI